MTLRDLERAADVLENFGAHWEAIKDDRKAQEELIHLIVARVWVEGDRVVAISLRPNYHVAIGVENNKPTEVPVGFIPGRERRGSFAHVTRHFSYALPRDLGNEQLSRTSSCNDIQSNSLRAYQALISTR